MGLLALGLVVPRDIKGDRYGRTGGARANDLDEPICGEAGGVKREPEAGGIGAECAGRIRGAGSGEGEGDFAITDASGRREGEAVGEGLREQCPELGG